MSRDLLFEIGVEELPAVTDPETALDPGTPVTHAAIHDNLCFTNDDSAPRVVSLTDSSGNCPSSLRKFPPSPMIHVWITPHACGPFAALEGVGAGQIADGQTRWCDTAHGSGSTTFS